MRKVLLNIVKIIGVYVVFWHIAFFVILLSRGDTISFSIYGEFFKFLFSPGLAVPTFIQFAAIFLTVIFLIGRFLFINIRKYLRKRDSKAI